MRSGRRPDSVDADYFAPDPSRPSPFAADEIPLVFTGAMDYWPNIDAVTWFATDVLPALRAKRPIPLDGTIPDGMMMLGDAGMHEAPLLATVAHQDYDLNPTVQHMEEPSAIPRSRTIAIG